VENIYYQLILCERIIQKLFPPWKSLFPQWKTNFIKLFLCERTIQKYFLLGIHFQKKYFLVQNISNNVSLLVNAFELCNRPPSLWFISIIVIEQGTGIPKTDGQGSHCVAVDQQVMFVFTQVHIYSKQGRHSLPQTRSPRAKP
jgi:hypothetical protein